MTRSVLVTGGAGFIGSAVCRHLVGAGVDVLNIDALTYAGNLASLSTIDNAPNYRFARIDICDRSRGSRRRSGPFGRIMSSISPPRATSTARSPAATPSFRRTSSAPSPCSRRREPIGWSLPPRNATGSASCMCRPTRSMARSARSGLFVETTPYDPSSPYSASKAASDHLVSAWAHTYGFPALISNCSNNYGPYHFPEKLIPLVILNAIHGKPLPVYGAGANVRDWLYVEDHARALDLIVSRGRIGEKYNVGGRNERRNIDVVRTICAILDRLRPTGRPIRDAHRIRRRPARAMICATRSTPPSWRANSAGGRSRPSTPASRRPSAGTSTTNGGGVRCARKSMPASVSACCRRRRAHPLRAESRPQRRSGLSGEGHHSGGRRGHASAPDHSGGLEAARAGLRQADDLLSALRRHAGGAARGADHLDPARSAAVPPHARRRRAVGHALRIRRAADAERPRAGLRHRRILPRRRPGDAGARRQYLLWRRTGRPIEARGEAPEGGDRLRLSRAGSRALRRRRVRSERARDLDRGKARPGQDPTWPSRGSIFTTQRSSRSRRPSSPRRGANTRSPT